MPNRPAATLRRAQPTPGRIIYGIIDKRISLFCEIRERDLVQTVWLLFTKDDMRQGRPPRTILRDNRFKISGKIIVSNGYKIYTNTNFTIVRMIPELDGAVIFCSAPDSHFLANFTLKGLSESVSVHYICKLRLKTIYRILCISYQYQRKYCSPVNNISTDIIHC